MLDQVKVIAIWTLSRNTTLSLLGAWPNSREEYLLVVAAVGRGTVCATVIFVALAPRKRLIAEICAFKPIVETCTVIWIKSP
jgi:hypothetical protein